MRKHKSLKIFSMILVFMTCMAFVLTIATADQVPEIKITPYDNGTQGEEIDVNVSINNDNKKSFGSLLFTIEYDPAALTFDSYFFDRQLSKDKLTVLLLEDIDEETKELVIDENGKTNIYVVMTEPNGKEVAYDDLDFLTLTFTPTTEASGKEDIKISKVTMARASSDGVSEGEPVVVDKTDGYINVNVPVQSDSVKLDKTSYELDLSTSGSGKVEVKYLPENTTDSKEFTYSSSNEDVVTVDEKGNLVAKKDGNATITVNAFGKVLTANVVVKKSIVSISLDRTSLLMNKGDKKDLVATINPTDTTDDKTITWDSSNKNVATVDNGRVTAIGAGTTIISATTVNGKIATTEVSVNVPLNSASINKTKLTMGRGEESTLKVILDPIDAIIGNIEWLSSDSSIVSVEKDANKQTEAKITALKGGNATITAKFGTTVLTTEVTVNVPIESVLVNNANVKLLPEQSEEIIATIKPSDFSGDKTITWTSSNTEVATVDENGKITAVAPGTATITVKVQGITKIINVKVLKPINNIIVNETNVTMSRDTKKQLTVTITPLDAEESKDVEWTSTNPDIATVDENGIVTALKGGKTVIRATLPNGKYAESNVTVNVAVNQFNIDSQNEITLAKGKKQIITATITPSDATYQTITWNSKDSSIVSVKKLDDKKVELTAVAIGSTTIVGTLPEGKTVTVNVIVNNPISSIELSESSITLEKTKSKKITATINPEDTTDNKTITWSSSDERIAKVDQSGTIVAVSSGKATITAKVGNKSAEVDVNVIVPIEDFILESDNKVSIIVGNTMQLNTTIKPVDATESKKITWKSANTKVASVDENGIVKAIGKGTTKITGTLANGLTVQCVVTVNVIPVESIAFEKEEVTFYRNRKTSLSFIIKPANATEISKAVWTSSNNEILIVDQNGEVTPLKPGKATITVKMGEFEASMTAVVEEVKLTSISIRNDISKIKVGDVINLDIIKNPIDATENVTFTYEAMNNKIVQVDENGKLTAVGVGSTTIRITASNGVKVVYNVTVEGKVTPDTSVESVTSYGILSAIFLGGIIMAIKKLKENEISWS